MTAAAADSARTVILAIDSATTRVVVAVGTRSGELIEATDWPAGYRHGETLLPADRRIAREARALDRPRRRPSSSAPVRERSPACGSGSRRPRAWPMRWACRSSGSRPRMRCSPERQQDAVLLLPAGPSDRLLVRRGVPARLVRAGEDPDLPSRRLADRARPRRPGTGRCARTGRGGPRRARGRARLLGAARLAAGDVDDLAGLVPEYVTLPRGVRSESGEVSWSRDPR